MRATLNGVSLRFDEWAHNEWAHPLELVPTIHKRHPGVRRIVREGKQ